ncbi:MAG: hypothetical protein GY822_27640 [Deltaproteobacteria bacterium]|nr:hypothetical protein [Deltaproteobacteria bacterium]
MPTKMWFLPLRNGRRFSRRRIALLLMLSLTLFVASCVATEGTPDAEPAPGVDEPDVGPQTDPGPTAFVPDAPLGYPSTDVVTRIGRDDALDIATWNIENFPGAAGSAQQIAELIASMDLDIVVVEEITTEDAFNEIDDRLPYHYSALSSHTYSDGSSQKLGIFYRRDLLEMDSFSLLYSGTYEFPRPVIRAHFTLVDDRYAPFDFTLLGLHLKAGTQTEDRSRRADANVKLEEFVRGQVAGSADDDIVILGDFNEVLTTSAGRGVFSPWSDENLYTIHTQRLSDDDKVSFFPGNRLIDHIISTRSFSDVVNGFLPRIPDLETQVLNYEDNVSDYLPVVLPVPLTLVE